MRETAKEASPRISNQNAPGGSARLMDHSEHPFVDRHGHPLIPDTPENSSSTQNDSGNSTSSEDIQQLLKSAVIAYLSEAEIKQSASEQKEGNRLQTKSIRVQKWLCFFTALAFAAAAYYAHIASGQKTTMDNQWTTMKGMFVESQSQSTSAAIAASGAITAAKAAQDNVLAVAKQMRQDQRPWLRVEFSPVPGVGNDPTKPMASRTFSTADPVSVPIRIRNTGKTPAKTITADLLIQTAGIDDPMFFPRDEVPIDNRTRRPSKDPPATVSPERRQIAAATLDNHIETGIIFPDTFTEREIVRDREQDGKPVPLLLTIPEAIDLIAGRTLLYVAGIVKYFDEFGISHSTRFCRPLSDASMNHRCARYNAVDSN